MVEAAEGMGLAWATAVAVGMEVVVAVAAAEQQHPLAPRCSQALGRSWPVVDVGFGKKSSSHRCFDVPLSELVYVLSNDDNGPSFGFLLLPHCLFL